MIASRRWALWMLSVLISLVGMSQPVFAEAEEIAAEEIAAAAPLVPSTVRAIARINEPITVDGRLDEAVWQQAAPIALAFERLPGDGIPPPVATEAYLLYDEKNLYVAFRAFDPAPAGIRAHLMDRDRIETLVQDDHVALLLDTYNDSRRAFQFRVNPLGVQADAIYSQLDETEDFSWDMIWESAGTLGPDGYNVEMAIPFNQLRFPRHAGDLVWGIGFERSWPRDVRHRIEAHRVDRNNSCVLCQLPRFSGFTDLEPGRNLELTPSLTYDRTDQTSNPGAGLDRGEDDFEPGLSVRWGVTPSLTLNATVNPDFSQVEADASQLFVNERFALFFDEKRPFFLEGIDTFRTQINSVSTRTVADPKWGLKLTGKTGPNTLGFFVASDEVNNITVPSNDRTLLALLDGGVDTAVGRWRRDLGKSSTLGVIYAGREGENGYFNRVGGLDSHWRINDKQVLRVQALASETAYPDDFAAYLNQELGSFGGHAFEALWGFEDENWIYTAGWRSFDPNFRADTGFVPQVDVETWRGQVLRKFWGEDEDFFNQITLGGTYLHSRNHQGELTSNKVELQAGFAGPFQSQTDVVAIFRDERVGGILFEGLETGELKLAFQPNEALRFGLDVSVGDTVEFSNLILADEWILELDAEIKAGDHLNLQSQWLEQTLDGPAGRLFQSRFADLKLTWQFNIRTFARCLFQWRNIDYAPENYPAEPPVDSEVLATQWLFSYKINPQTVLFVGYSDRYLGEGERIDLEQDRRTFFVKMSYAFLR